MFSKVGKICQRQLYTWLSSRCGIPVLVVGVLVVLISLLQFGGVFLEWSKERYAVQFSIYADNIVGKSFESHLCPTLPIDIVYTWVNGSDPQLLAELREIKKELVKDESSEHKTNASSCPFEHCTSWRALVIDAHNSTSHDPHTLTSTFPTLGGKVVWVEFINKTGEHVPSVFVAQLKKESDVKSIAAVGMLTDRDGNNISVTEAYLTTDAKLVGGVKLPGFGLALCNGIKPTNTSKLLKKWMDSKFSRQVLEVDVRGNQTAVCRFHPGELETALHSNQSHQFSGQPLKLHQAYLIWLPFSLPEATGRAPEQISANRFQDNEELRYSLRSVEQFAPWVRHIFLVTNGQIPSWLNLENPRLTIVTHEEIFPNKSHLPTYSSPAIEAHIHRIPGLSQNFIYLNDDVMFGEEVWPEDFYTPQRGQKVFLSWPVPQCAEGCPANWITDKFCDKACNVSECDWDGGDCTNMSRPGPIGGGAGGFGWGGQTANNQDQCSTGCINTWLGDRYCDSACRVPDCGYDAGDCGTEHWDELLVYQVKNGSHYNIPLGTKALYFNLTSYFLNATITVAEYTPSSVIRTAVVAKKYRSLGLTFARNASLSTVKFTFCGKVDEQTHCINFSLTGDTVRENKTLLGGAVDSRWSFNYTDTHSQEFLRAVAQRSNLSVDALPTVRPPPPQHSSPPPTSFPNLTVINYTLLPHNITNALAEIDTALKEGELTLRGYWVKKVAILEAVKDLVVTNGTVHVREKVKVHVNASEGPKNDTKTSEPAPSQQLGATRKLLTSTPLSTESRRRLPWEKWHVLPERNNTASTDPPAQVFRTRRLLGEDYFANSLKHVNNLYTKRYGHDSRKVPAHMPHFIQRPVMEELQSVFSEQYDITSSHRVRASNDMQFAFSYFYYLMSEKKNMVLEDVFAQLDTDRSGILSVRELRTLLSMLSDLPIELKHVESFQSMLESCDEAYNGTRPSVEPIEYETHYDPDLPLVTLDFIRNCSQLIEKLKGVFKTKSKFKHEEADEKQYVQFNMISENGSTVMGQLDHIRRERKKFICLNDNIDHSKPGADLAKLMLVDFYETLFPIPSQFELSVYYQNRFLHTKELRDWMKYRDRVQLFLHLVCGILLVLCIISLFYGKFLQWKRKATRYVSNCLDRRTSTV